VVNSSPNRAMTSRDRVMRSSEIKGNRRHRILRRTVFVGRARRRSSAHLRRCDGMALLKALSDPLVNTTGHSRIASDCHNVRSGVYSYSGRFDEAEACVGKVDAVVLEGLDLWFNSSDHRPPHLHARRRGEWEIRVYFLLCTDDELVFDCKWAKRIPRRRFSLEFAELSSSIESNCSGNGSRK
jgi:hypothetical protein